MKGLPQWDHVDDALAIIERARRGEWSWVGNMHCKYIELRIDMRDGSCIIKDKEGQRITPEELARQHTPGVIDVASGERWETWPERTATPAAVLIAAGRKAATGAICYCGRSGHDSKCPTHGRQDASQPPEPDDDLVVVLTRAAEDAERRRDGALLIGDRLIHGRDAARLRALASLVKAWREAKEAHAEVVAAYYGPDGGRLYDEERSALIRKLDAEKALLLACLRGAPTPTETKEGER